MTKLWTGRSCFCAGSVSNEKQGVDNALIIMPKQSYCTVNVWWKPGFSCIFCVMEGDNDAETVNAKYVA